MGKFMSEAEPGPFRLAASPSHLLHRAQQLASDRFTELVGDVVTLRQYVVLAAIAESPGLSQNDLVRATGIDRSTMAEMMTRMQKRGWISRATSAADKRRQSVHMAAAGAMILAAATPAAKAADAALLAALTRTKARSFLNTLVKLGKSADEAHENAARLARRQAKRERKRRKAKPKNEAPKRRRARD